MQVPGGDGHEELPCRQQEELGMQSCNAGWQELEMQSCNAGYQEELGLQSCNAEL